MSNPGINRGYRGQYAQAPDAAMKRRESALMKARGHRYQDIADLYWNGSLATAKRQVSKYWAEQGEAKPLEKRAEALDVLDEMQRKIRDIMDRTHYVVDKGMVVHDPQGNPLEDSDVQLRAINGIVKLVETTMKLVPGMQAPKTTTEISSDDLAAQIAKEREELGILKAEEEGEEE